MSLRQEVAAILMDHTDGMQEATYKAILDELGKIPADRDPAEAKDLQKELTAQGERTRQLEDDVYQYQEQYQFVVRENQRLHTYSLQESVAHTITRRKLDSQTQAAILSRLRNVELYRRLHQMAKAIKQPGLLSPEDRKLYSLTIIPTGVYFDNDALEKDTLKAVQELFSKYQSRYEKHSRKRYWDVWRKVDHLQQQIDHLTKTLRHVSAYHLFLREATQGSLQIEGSRPTNSREWGQYWRDSSTAFRESFQEKARETWRIAYPYNPERTVQRSREGYIRCKKDSQAYRTQLGVIEQIQMDLEFLNKHSVDVSETQNQLEENQDKLQGYLQEIASLRIYL
jgi:hypothetical protein